MSDFNGLTTADFIANFTFLPVMPEHKLRKLAGLMLFPVQYRTMFLAVIDSGWRFSNWDYELITLGAGHLTCHGWSYLIQYFSEYEVEANFVNRAFPLGDVVSPLLMEDMHSFFLTRPGIFPYWQFQRIPFPVQLGAEDKDLDFKVLFTVWFMNSLYQVQIARIVGEALII